MLEIRKPDILRRLTTRLGVKPPPGGPMGWLSTMVLLTTSVDDLLVAAKIKFSGTVSVGAAGQVTAFTVPKGKRWRLFHYTLDKIGGTFSFSQFIVNDGTNIIALDIFTASDSPRSANFNGQSYLLNEDWLVVANITGYSVPGSFEMRLMVEEEDAF